MSPDDFPVHLVYLFNVSFDPSEEIGEVLCQTERDLRALKYALKHVEYIGYEVKPLDETWLTDVQAFYCQRCNHVWLPKGGGTAKGKEPPKVCPVCKNYDWQKKSTRN